MKSINEERCDGSSCSIDRQFKKALRKEIDTMDTYEPIKLSGNVTLEKRVAAPSHGDIKLRAKIDENGRKNIASRNKAGGYSGYFIAFVFNDTAGFWDYLAIWFEIPGAPRRFASDTAMQMQTPQLIKRLSACKDRFVHWNHEKERYELRST